MKDEQVKYHPRNHLDEIGSLPEPCRGTDGRLLKRDVWHKLCLKENSLGTRDLKRFTSPPYDFPFADIMMKSRTITIVIETPKGSRNKYAYEEDNKYYVLRKVLPKGMSFPHDFGFIPETCGDDGDPLDVLLIHEEPTFPGCRIESRLIGVVEGEEIPQKGKKLRNDRLIAVSSLSAEHGELQTIKDLPKHFLDELEHFLISYHDLEDKKFRLLNCTGPKRAGKLLDEGKRRCQNLKN